MQHSKRNTQIASKLNHSFPANYRHHRPTLWLLMTWIVYCFLFVSCAKKSITFTAKQRKTADSIIHTVTHTDSLALLQKQLEDQGDKLGSIVALRVWGKALRNENRFEQALKVHSKALQQAESIGDTLEWVQALNNMGTDYRRIGMLDLAQAYHYRAWLLSKESADTSFWAKKNRTVSLNGLGNVYITIGNYKRADSILRLALEIERQLNSVLGQAINYANLGYIHEHNGSIDSAWVYYRKSMTLNIEAGSNLGISLCHNNFGSLYQKTKQYNKAIEEFETAYRLMKGSKDKWHTLSILISLAEIYHTTQSYAKEMEYLAKAKKTAQSIKSLEHLAKIHTLYYRHHKQAGNYQLALVYHELATAQQDSLLNMEKINRIQNVSLNIERTYQAQKMDNAKQIIEKERTACHMGFTILGVTLIALIGTMLFFLYIQYSHKRKRVQQKTATTPILFKKNYETKYNTTKDADLRFLEKVSSIVHRQLNNNKEADVSIVAAHMCMSPRQFYRKINAITSYTPSAYILRLKIKRATTLLGNNPQISLGEVADKCGFSEYPNFVRAFKLVYGVTPTSYRKEHCT